MVHTLSLVGYTNAGKSTLFNSLTAADVYAEDKLFATLDPTLRKLNVETEHDTILIDTVGFIRHLPHSLVAAFRSTLEETQEASLLLHVIDAHDDGRHERIDEVNGVLKEVGAEEIPQLEIYNKIDLIDAAEPRIDRSEDGRPVRVWVSAKLGTGLDLLRQAVTELLQWQESDQHGEQIFVGQVSGRQHFHLRLQPSAGRLRAELFERDLVVQEQILENGDWLLEIFAWPRQVETFCRVDGCQLIADKTYDSVINL